MNLILAFALSWLMLGLLHYGLCMNDWRREARKGHIRPHAWRYVLAVAVPMIAFGPIGLLIREWTRVRFPQWFE